MTRIVAPLLVAAVAAIAVPAASQPAGQRWMTEEAMRTAFIGKTLDGSYADRREWAETYSADGRLDYRESSRRGLGYWFFRRHVFCTFYDPGQGLNGGCFTAVQVGANCYEFYLSGLDEREVDGRTAPGPADNWVARASRRGEPSTCEARPTV